MTAAPDDFDETLLSAYLDNELTSSERKAVEEQLATSSELRKLLEELQSIRSMVQQLHGQSLRRSFTDGPWNLPSDQGNQPVVLAQPDQALTTGSSRNSSQAWSWQRLASLAAMLVIALGVGGLWWASGHRGSTDPLGYTPKNERDWKEKGAMDGPPQDSLLSEELGTRTEQPSNQPMEPPLDAPASVRKGESSERGLVPEPPAPILSKSLSPGGRGATPPNDSMPSDPAPMNPPAPAPSPVDAAKMDGPATYSLRNRQPKQNSDSRGEPENAPVAMNDIPIESRERSDRLALVLLPIETQSNYRRLQFNEPPNRFAGGGNGQDKAARDANQTLSEQEHETPNAIVYRFIRPPAKEPNLTQMDVKDDQSRASDLALTPADQAKVPAGPGGSGVAREQENLQRQTLEFRRLASDFDSDKSVVVEFQVPKEDWELGSSELRQLGVQVPVEIPESQVLDLQGRLASNPTDWVDQRDTDATNGREDSMKEAKFRWSLVVPDVSRDTNQKENVAEDKPVSEALEAKKLKQEMVRSASREDGLIRIRVRITMSEP